MGRSRYNVVEGYETYFATATTVNWIPLFAKPELAEIVLGSFQFLHLNRRLLIHAYVLMEDHLHLVASSEDFSSEMKHMKSFTARRIVDWLIRTKFRRILRELQFGKKSHKLEQDYQVWQEGFHPEAIVDYDMLRGKIEYIHHNPVRRGYVDEPAAWRYSSSRQYDGKSGLTPIKPIA